MATPPYRIETERLVIRCWEPRDAPILKEAIDSSLEHLRPWMPWAHNEPQTLEEKIELLRGFRSAFDADEDYVYGILSADELQVLGGTGLHTRVGDGAFEIGYWIRAGATGNGLMTEAAAALTRVAFQLCNADRVEIHVEPANHISARIPHKLGYREEALLRRRLPRPTPDEPKADIVVFTMLAEEFAGSAAERRSAQLTAFDAAGRRLA